MDLCNLAGGFALSVCLACTPQVDSGGESNSDADASESGMEEEVTCTEPCEIMCAESLPALSCQPDLLCEVIDYQTCEEGGVASAQDAEAIQCMVDALIAQDPGQLQLETIQQDAADQFRLVILDDGTLVERHHIFAPANNRDDYRVGQLQAPAYFEDCDANSTDMCDKFECVRDWIDQSSCGGLTLPEECAPG